MAGLTHRVHPWICCYSSHRNLSWHGDLAERKMQTVESLVCGLGWETSAALGVCHRAGVCARRDGRRRAARAWAQVAPGCFHRDRRAWGALGWNPFPFPCSQLSHGGDNPIPSAGGERGFIFTGGKLGGDFRCTQHWTTGLPLSTGTVLTVYNPSETPVLTLESLF